ncbi:fibronectin type III domain-containing protein [Nocardioides mangrovi]|uniref:Fibronectin type III domain-containing protein n=1 Tax=Nocardioides mangrovi TaxID=2874580 RepID=A0ABS7U9V9_9ACTN|nr:fibronectin type III domain-containing protein [Nocardioides mangrovi]MBZ5737655.1 fibronectin type III domain-containing protein [Nocardioides mangrovi]
MPRAVATLLAGAAVAAAAGLAALPSESAGAASTTTLQAIPADSVVDSYGIGIHTNFLDTPYRDYGAVADALAGLGVRHVRDDLYLDAPRQYAAIKAVAQRAGVRFDLILGRPTDSATPADYVDTVADQLSGGAVESLEGTNEWDLSGRSDWPSELLDWQEGLYRAARANPATADLPLLSPALAFRWNYPQTDGLSSYADIANAHVYPGGYVPSTEITKVLAALIDAVPEQKTITTEAGYHNALNAQSSHPAVPEDVAAAYLPRLLLEHVSRGDSRMYSYELIDEFDDPGLTNPEAHFGLLRHDLSPKPAYTTMQNLLALLDDPGTSFRPGSLPISVSGWPSDGKYLLTQRSDGSYVLLLWRDASLWDPGSQTRQTVTPASVTLGFGSSYDVAVHHLDSAAPVATSTGSSVTVDLDAAVTAIELDPATTATPTPTTPTATPTPTASTSPTTSASPTPTATTTPEVTTCPTAVVAKAARRHVTVRWQPAPDDGVTAYRLKIGGRTLLLGPDDTRAKVRGLPRGARVRATVTARNAAGWGAATRSAYVRLG